MTTRPGTWTSGLGGDLRLAVRSLWKHPGHALVAMLTLAVATGAATAVFSVLHAIVLRPLPYVDPDRLVNVRDSSPPRFPSFSVSPGRFVEWQARGRVFEGFAATANGSVTLTGAGDPEQWQVTRASANLFDLLGQPLLAGRPFTEEEDRADGPRAVILSEGLWRSRFGGRLDLIGQTITLDGNPTEVVGVLATPPEGANPSRAWLPLRLSDEDRQRYGSHYLRVVGRMRPGVSLETAREDLARAAAELAADIPEGNESWTTLVEPLHDVVVGGARQGLTLLVWAAAVVLLIACANVAGLLLARGADRQREIALRAALGASRLRLTRQLLVESLLLGAGGALGGVVVAAATLRALLSASWTSLPRVAGVPLDGWTLGFAASLALATPLVFGMLPALQVASTSPGWRLVGGRTGATSLRSRTRSTLIVAEVALAVVLVSGASLLLRSLDRILQVDPGFQADGVLVLNVTLPSSRYPTPVERAAFMQLLVERAAVLPGVASVARSQSVPFFGDYVASLDIDGRESPPESRPPSNFYAVSPGYFETMGIPIVAGRAFTGADRGDGARVAIVSRQLATRVFGTTDVLGRQVRASQGPREDFAEIVGVAGDVRQYGLDTDMTLQIYEPASQHSYFGSNQLLVRTSLPPADLTATVRAAVRELDPLLPVAEASTLAEAVGRSTGSRRFTTALLGGLALVALLLAAVGVYALVSFSVGRRVQEFGVRIALGADRGSIMSLVLGQGLRLALGGVVIGLAGAIAAGRLVDAMLFGVSPRDPLTLGVASAMLLLSTVIACAAPALRALRVNPVTALRQS